MNGVTNQLLWLVNSGAWKLCGPGYSLLTLENIPVFQLTKTWLTPDDVWLPLKKKKTTTHWTKWQYWEKLPPTILFFWHLFFNILFWTVSSCMPKQGKQDNELPCVHPASKAINSCSVLLHLYLSASLSPLWDFFKVNCKHPIIFMCKQFIN